MCRIISAGENKPGNLRKEVFGKSQTTDSLIRRIQGGISPVAVVFQEDDIETYHSMYFRVVRIIGGCVIE